MNEGCPWYQDIPVTKRGIKSILPNVHTADDEPVLATLHETSNKDHKIKNIEGLCVLAHLLSRTLPQLVTEFGNDQPHGICTNCNLTVDLGLFKIIEIGEPSRFQKKYQRNTDYDNPDNWKKILGSYDPNTM